MSKNNLDMVGGVPWRTPREKGAEDDGVMPAIGIPMEMPEAVTVETPEHRGGGCTKETVHQGQGLRQARIHFRLYEG